jgi:SAM-dependent methyltransferase
VAEIGDSGIDFDRANAARMYDYFLGGGHNFAIDREHANRLTEANPDAPYMARSNRAFLGRIVRWCTERGVDQFLDLGSGVPTVGNVHEIAHRDLPHARVAYVDYEPVAAAHAAEIVADVDTVTSTRADLRDAEAVLAAPGVAGLLDLSRPVALLAISCLHFVPGDVQSVMDTYRRHLAPGSVLGLSHISDDHLDAGTAERISALSQAFNGSASNTTLRTRAEVEALFGDWRLVPPGLVDVIEWPEPSTGREARATGYHAGVAVAP